MSRVGNVPIEIPSGVDVDINGEKVTIKGPKGQLEQVFHKDISIGLEDNKLMVRRPSDSKNHKALHGLTRSLLVNMVEGVTKGYSKVLEINGVGYRAALQGKKLVLTVGYSHPVEITTDEGIELEVPTPTQVVVKGIDKQKVGQVAADIRATKPPEPYQGKGIKYKEERIRRKAGKTA